MGETSRTGPRPYNWVMLAALDAHPPTPVTHTIVYFAPSYQPAAKRIARELGARPRDAR